MLRAILFDSRTKDTAAVVAPTGSVIAFVTMANLKSTLEIALLLLTVAYTLWRWRRDYQKTNDSPTCERSAQCPKTCRYLLTHARRD